MTTAQTSDSTSSGTELLISSDSHIIEPADLWVKAMPASQRDAVPSFSGERGDNKPGGTSGKERVSEMAADGVSAEFLYPTLGLRLFGIEDQETQEAACRIGNDYMAEYCSAAPDRIWGIPMISCYNIPNAIKELERCKAMGLKGALIWQVPPEHLRFTTDHYEDLWAAAEDLDMPVNLHILSGFNYSRQASGTYGPVDAYRNSVNTKLNDAVTSVFDLVFTGAMDRYPKLKFVLVENEMGWIPLRGAPVGPLREAVWPPAAHPHQRAAQLLRQPAGVLDVHRRPARGAHDPGVGRGQLYVVQRLPARRLDVAELQGGHRAGPGPPAAGDVPQGGAGERAEALQPAARIATD